MSKLGRLLKFSRDQTGDNILFKAVYNHIRRSNATTIIFLLISHPVVLQDDDISIDITSNDAAG
jgi:hypothetical protein